MLGSVRAAPGRVGSCADVPPGDSVCSLVLWLRTSLLRLRSALWRLLLAVRLRLFGVLAGGVAQNSVPQVRVAREGYLRPVR